MTSFWLSSLLSFWDDETSSHPSDANLRQLPSLPSAKSHTDRLSSPFQSYAILHLSHARPSCHQGNSKNQGDCQTIQLPRKFLMHPYTCSIFAGHKKPAILVPKNTILSFQSFNHIIASNIKRNSADYWKSTNRKIMIINDQEGNVAPL